MTEVSWPTVGHRGGTVGNPDALTRAIDGVGRVTLSDFFGASARKERPVHDGHRHLPGWIGNGDRKDACIFVVDAFELDALVRPERGQSEPLPAE